MTHNTDDSTEVSNSIENLIFGGDTNESGNFCLTEKEILPRQKMKLKIETVKSSSKKKERGKARKEMND